MARALLAATGIALAAAGAQAAKDTPFGIGFSVANFPDGGAAELNDTIAAANSIGGHMSFVWSWKNRKSLPILRGVIPPAQASGLKILLQVAPTALGKPVPPSGYVKDWNDPDTRQQYLDDIAELAALAPEYLNLCAEVNLMYYLHRDQFDAYVSLYKEAYDLAKSISPQTQVGFSLLHVLWVGDREFQLHLDLGPFDFVGFTTYPDKLFRDGVIPGGTLADFPAWWYTVNRTVFPDTPILYTEVGWTSRETSTEEEQRQFVARLPELLAEVRPERITWTLLHDTSFFDVANLTQEATDALVALDVDPQVLFNRFNGMGLLSNDGTAKPAWFEAKELVFDWAAAGPAP